MGEIRRIPADLADLADLREGTFAMGLSTYVAFFFLCHKLFSLSKLSTYSPEENSSDPA
jgi:hypothetical protein